MDNLTVMLAILGGLVLAGIVAHGAWSTRRADPRKPDHEDRPTIPGLDGHADTEPMLEQAPSGSSSTAKGARMPGRRSDPHLLP
jgi:hypothetical protein